MKNKLKQGYGDVTPISESEVQFNIVVIILSCIMFGYILNKIGQIFSNIDDANVEFR
jgi:hypothetical protein